MNIASVITRELFFVLLALSVTLFFTRMIISSFCKWFVISTLYPGPKTMKVIVFALISTLISALIVATYVWWETVGLCIAYGVLTLISVLITPSQEYYKNRKMIRGFRIVTLIFAGATVCWVFIFFTI